MINKIVHLFDELINSKSADHKLHDLSEIVDFFSDEYNGSSDYISINTLGKK